MRDRKEDKELPRSEATDNGTRAQNESARAEQAGRKH